MPNFRPVLNILPLYFGGGVLVPGEKQSQLLDLSLGLGLEFDNNKRLVVTPYASMGENTHGDLPEGVGDYLKGQNIQ